MDNQRTLKFCLKLLKSTQNRSKLKGAGRSDFICFIVTYLPALRAMEEYRKISHGSCPQAVCTEDKNMYSRRQKDEEKKRALG